MLLFLTTGAPIKDIKSKIKRLLKQTFAYNLLQTPLKLISLTIFVHLRSFTQL